MDLPFGVGSARSLHPLAGLGSRSPPRPPHVRAAQGFIRPASRGIVLSATSPGDLIDKLSAYQAPPSLISLASQGLLDVHERG